MPGRRRLLVLAAAVAPWTWFVWRDGLVVPAVGRLPPLGVVEPVAIFLPVLVALGVVTALVVAAWRWWRGRARANPAEGGGVRANPAEGGGVRAYPAEGGGVRAYPAEGGGVRAYPAEGGGVQRRGARTRGAHFAGAHAAEGGGVWGPLGVAASAVVFLLVAVVLPWRPQGGPAPVSPLRVVVANSRFDNRHPQAAADIVARRGDLVVVPEVSDALHRRLAAAYPYGLRVYGGIDQGAVGVYSRFPLARADLRRTLLDGGAFRLTVDGPTGPLVLYAVHLTPPGLGRRLSPGQQALLVDRLRRAAADEAEPVVVAGDFNLVDRSGLFGRLTTHLDDATADHWRGPTSRRWWPLLARIDHILVTPGWCAGDAATFSVSGSDHRGITAAVGPCPTARSSG